MPVLKTYADGSGHYIHASVRGAVITFQTTERGIGKLTAVGVHPGNRFALHLLADLTRTGDAYTHRGGVELHETEQCEFDFSESEQSKAFFPACAVTGTFDDLHLVVHGAAGEPHIELLASTPRSAPTDHVHLSVPLFLLSARALTALEQAGELALGSETVAALRRWDAIDASAEWERLRRQRESRQQGFALDFSGELKL